MLGKNETFKPPEEYEKWTDGEFSNVLDYLSEKKVNFNGSIFIQWLAVPYISIWFARSTEFKDHKIWILHNLEFTDYILSIKIKTPRDAILEFAAKWSSAENESLRVRDNDISKLTAYSKMLFNVGNDEELWIEENR